MNYMTLRRPTATVNGGVNTLGSFDRLFDSVFGAMPGWDDRKFAVDIRTDEHQYTIEADLPGIVEDQIDVRIEDNLLVISSKDEKSAEGENQAEPEGYILRERRRNAFYRSFALPKDADPGKIEAAYRNGVLTVTIQKKPEAKPRQIKITRG